MSKHPGPWTFHPFGNIHDSNRELVCGSVTGDHETRAVLLHAAEMWQALQRFAETPVDSKAGRAVDRELCLLVSKIESEITAARRP